MKTTPDWRFPDLQATQKPAWPLTVIRWTVWLMVINLLLMTTMLGLRLYPVGVEIPGLLAFRILFLAMQIGVLLACLAAIALATILLMKYRGIVRPALLILVAGITPPLLAIISVGPDRIGLPMIHDISTDTLAPPRFMVTPDFRNPGDNSLEYGGPQLAAAQQLAYPDISTLHTRLTPGEALDETTRVVKDLGWEFMNIDYDAGIVEAYDTTRIFGFIDDIVIRVRPEPGGSRIDIRSASRAGRGDLGKNAERIRLFLSTFRE